jgi:tRNA U34 5-carboxymethylaminomethyl modifying GTPase MnmE/TrmE
MNETRLRAQLVRLAHSRPALRPYLLPMLKKAAAPEDVVKKILAEMNAANQMKFKVSPPQRKTLIEAVTKMQAAGASFDSDMVLDLADGEMDENEEKYGKMKGFKELNETLNDIFEPS